MLTFINRLRQSKSRKRRIALHRAHAARIWHEAHPHQAALEWLVGGIGGLILATCFIISLA